MRESASHTRVKGGCCITWSWDSESRLFLPQHTCSSKQKINLKTICRWSNGHKSSMFTTVNVCLCRICHRHEENTHTHTEARSNCFPVSLTFSPTPPVVHVFVIIFIDYIQVKLTLQPPHSPCQHKHESEPHQLGNTATTQHTGIPCVQPVRATTTLSSKTIDR